MLVANSRILLAGALAGFLLAAPSAALQKSGAKDTVQLKDGKTESGKIEEEDWSGIVIKGIDPIPWDKVVSVDYSGESKYDAALRAFTEGKNAEALAAFQALKQEKPRPPIQQHVLFYIPLLQQRTGDIDGAIASFNELIDAFPKGRYLNAAADNLFRLHLAKKDVKGAEAALDRIGNATVSLKEFQPQISLLKGRLLEIQKDYSRAEVSYDFAERSGGASPAMVQEAKLGRARCLYGLGKRADAEGAFRKLISDGTTNNILAGAWNGLGDIAADEGKEKRDPQKLLGALYAYLRGVVQYAPVPGEPTLEYEHALAGAARSFRLISELESNDERRRLYAERARVHEEQLRAEFPNSIYLEML